MDKVTKEILAHVKKHRAMPTNTCPASRHAEMIGDHLIHNKPYAMLAEEPEHCGGSILSAVGSLYAARTENKRLRDLLNDKDYIRQKADYNKGHLSWYNMLQARESGLGLGNQEEP